jgi:hypothetical protein
MSASSLRFVEAIELFQVFDLAAFPSRTKYQLALSVSIRLPEHLCVGTMAPAVAPDSPKQYALDHVPDIPFDSKRFIVRGKFPVSNSAYSRGIAPHFLECVEEINRKA